MSVETEIYLAKIRKTVDGLNNGEPDCFLVYKTDAEEQIVGEPLAIYKKEEVI